MSETLSVPPQNPREDLDAARAIRLGVFSHEMGFDRDRVLAIFDASATQLLLQSRRNETDPWITVAAAQLTLLPPGPETHPLGLAKVSLVAVRKGYRGAGMGSLLMRAAENEARRITLGGVVLSAQEPAVPFYERIGYDKIGEASYADGVLHWKMQRLFS
ncbi:acyl-CoA N-acyltransferase [Zopfochytrium polystomum]|nr:acyl-CoA N-acyltransferase [Zopfochytrium polystomum]